MTRGVADIQVHNLSGFSHQLCRVSGIGQTDAEIALMVRGIDVRAIDRNLINAIDYHRLYLEAQRYERNDPTVAKEVQRLGLVDHGDPALAQILRRQGFDGPPRLVDAEGMREAIDEGWIEMSRGVRRPEDAENFKTGDLYPGVGSSGSGTYVYGRAPGSTEPDSAQLQKFAEHYAAGGLDPGAVIHMAMRPDALTTDLRSLTAKRDAELEWIRAELENTPEKSTRRTELEERINVLSDVGRYAAIKGYDAYRINDVYAWVVLNRTALIVER
ncbi:hypothetical protein [Nocardia sp. NPDC049149]|uniref:hypothetical protein n=1 Tax=Nocardia sp. NPDC049149 TaxID=3364315 RepID=UPI0037151DDA